MHKRHHVSVNKSRTLPHHQRVRALPQVYLGRQRQPIRDIYLSEDPDSRPHGRFRWLISICLAGAVGVLAIAVLVGGSINSFTEALQKGVSQPVQSPTPTSDGLKWALPKSGRLLSATGEKLAKDIIHETMRQRRGQRTILLIKPYARLSAKLSSLTGSESEKVPTFNPFKLYSAAPLASRKGGNAARRRRQVAIKVIDLAQGVLPVEDGQQMETAEVTQLVHRLILETKEALNPAASSGANAQLAANEASADTAPSPGASVGTIHKTVLLKNIFEAESDPGSETRGAEIKAVRVRRGDSLIALIQNVGAAPWQASQMARAAQTIFPAKALVPGQEIYFTLVPQLSQPERVEPIRFSIFASGQRHLVTVTRNAGGDFTASASAIAKSLPFGSVSQAILSGQVPRQQTNVYASLYHAGLQLGLSRARIMKILRVYAYDIDFRKRVRAGDRIDFFFDLADESKGPESPVGQMLYTSLMVGGQRKEFYRFRSADGHVDYYDVAGNNSKKFITRKPVRSQQARLTSRFGMRFHPIKKRRTMHNGVDWAAPTGTPIMAAGSGTIEKAVYERYNGNYIRIRHANGYKTSYSHLHRFGRGIARGKKVRQGQVIGSVGSTGRSTGPHLHFEVLVNNRRINPMKMRVPRERRLRGKDLVAYQRERARIDDLRRRPPVTRPVTRADR